MIPKPILLIALLSLLLLQIGGFNVRADGTGSRCWIVGSMLSMKQDQKGFDLGVKKMVLTVWLYGILAGKLWPVISLRLIAASKTCK